MKAGSRACREAEGLRQNLPVERQGRFMNIEIRFEEASVASVHSVASNHQSCTFVDTLAAQKKRVKLHRANA
jgi:hypothetical protein